MVNSSLRERKRKEIVHRILRQFCSSLECKRGMKGGKKVDPRYASLATVATRGSVSKGENSSLMYAAHINRDLIVLFLIMSKSKRTSVLSLVCEQLQL